MTFFAFPKRLILKRENSSFKYTGQSKCSTTCWNNHHTLCITNRRKSKKEYIEVCIGFLESDFHLENVYYTDEESVVFRLPRLS